MSIQKEIKNTIRNSRSKTMGVKEITRKVNQDNQTLKHELIKMIQNNKLQPTDVAIKNGELIILRVKL